MTTVKLCRQLKTLDLSHNRISDLSSLQSLGKMSYTHPLENLNLDDNLITEFTQLKYLTNLKCLKDLYLFKNYDKKAGDFPNEYEIYAQSVLNC